MTQTAETAFELGLEAENDTENQTERDQEASAFAASLEDFDPEEAISQQEAANEAEKAESKAIDEGSEAFAFMAINTYESVLQMAHPDFKLTDEVKQKAIDSYGPVIKKYGPQLMATMGQYQAEISAGLFTATLAVQSYQQLKQLKLEEQRQEAANDDQKEPETNATH
ncbi:hypothetical protein [Algicola sagamiensis]|uniref:hypothetical protein n=1 Tax=Algicola sagamiensis TaxID=163869 RepID=UPI00039AB427|nr:hypothetical protein [Algicola sagamiensis]